MTTNTLAVSATSDADRRDRHRRLRRRARARVAGRDSDSGHAGADHAAAARRRARGHVARPRRRRGEHGAVPRRGRGRACRCSRRSARRASRGSSVRPADTCSRIRSRRSSPASLARRATSLLGRWVAALAGTTVLSARRARAARDPHRQRASGRPARHSPVRPARRGEGARRRAARSEIDPSRARLTARDFFWDSTGTLRPPWRLAVFAVASVVSLIVVDGAARARSCGGAARARSACAWSCCIRGRCSRRWCSAPCVDVSLVEPRRLDASSRLDAIGAARPRPLAIGAALGALARSRCRSLP